MTVRYRSATLGEFIEHHSYDVSRGGMFIKTPSPFPAGTLLKFEVKIAEEQRLMQGVGRVVWKREGDQAGEHAPSGMGIKFIKIDEASHAVIERLVENRGHGGPSAFDQSAPAGGSTPPKSRRMFPEHAPSTPPPVAAEAPVPEGVTPPGLDESSSPSIESAATSDSGDAAIVREAAGETRPAIEGAAKKVERTVAPSAAKARSRHWFLIAIVLLFVLGLLYVLTHKAPADPAGSRGSANSALPEALAAGAPRNPISAC
jgi:uncharacterized protein (TIGR02266 family)